MIRRGPFGWPLLLLCSLLFSCSPPHGDKPRGKPPAPDRAQITEGELKQLVDRLDVWELIRLRDSISSDRNAERLAVVNAAIKPRSTRRLDHLKTRIADLTDYLSRSSGAVPPCVDRFGQRQVASMCIEFVRLFESSQVVSPNPDWIQDLGQAEVQCAHLYSTFFVSIIVITLERGSGKTDPLLDAQGAYSLWMRWKSIAPDVLMEHLGKNAFDWAEKRLRELATP